MLGLAISAVGMLLASVPLVLGGSARLKAGALEITYRDRVSDCGALARRLPLRGIVFFPAYALSSLWQLLRGRHPYRDNHFEVEARVRSGGVA